MGGEITRRFLAGIGTDVELVNTAAEAITKARARKPDIVLMEHRLPDLSGGQTRLRLLEGCEDGEFPIVCTTTAVLAHERRALQDDGFEHFLDKPLRAAELYACLSALLKVEYDYGEATVVDEEFRAEWDAISVNFELASQLLEAAERQSPSELRKHLDTLASSGGPEADLAAHLIRLSRRFDMEAIKIALRKLQPSS